MVGGEAGIHPSDMPSFLFRGDPRSTQRTREEGIQFNCLRSYPCPFREYGDDALWPDPKLSACLSPHACVVYACATDDPSFPPLDSNAFR